MNRDLDTICTPLDVNQYTQLLCETNFDPKEADFLIEGFTNGFNIGYNGPKTRQSTSQNIPLTIGTREELWSKIMKEVKAGRIAGPYDDIPFDNYIQSL